MANSLKSQKGGTANGQDVRFYDSKVTNLATGPPVCES